MGSVILVRRRELLVGRHRVDLGGQQEMMVSVLPPGLQIFRAREALLAALRQQAFAPGARPLLKQGLTRATISSAVSPTARQQAPTTLCGGLADGEITSVLP